CSHVGGDRFAANLIVLPHGLTYGHVSSESAAERGGRYDGGKVVPELLRGGSAFAAAVQAAQHFARTAGGSEHVDALRPRRLQQDSDDLWTVELDGFTVTVRTRMRKVDGAMTCASRPPGQMRVFDLVSISPGPR